ncbi:MAG: glycine--tRNA ligase [Candidatus Harrisonbacteria bacterium RIFCSPLOWO2_01_FULL_40_28]|uniref:Glycine--tRNA ligase n=2 Tax=Candidatus Harrisoniibacteriota TaxID=1817905 RepID=A0A1G1ZWD6_9BACT|nr:MAG: glycine--tRNA ligase [Candidatus Harrisonbacteria bacterium RIFCSPLOWO2_01_FULL_40_28]OGY68852.1 MAG: glycine--tRNA ligase [Candidatus Harrisonbacteria bacterium RIFOXYD1_FULL_40_9]
MTQLLEKVIALSKRRGFIFPGSEIYGGLQNSWDYGPLGVELKNNIKQLWWERFVRRRDDIVGIDPAMIMNPKVWEASGHVKGFTDPLRECKKCHERWRADQIGDSCLNCGSKDLSVARNFNLLFRTFLGPIEDSSAEVFLRGELAQAMFVDFVNVIKTSRVRVPFGIAAQGQVFRNEITPGNFIFRTREFELMEFEYFIRENEWEKWFEYWRQEMHAWIGLLGIDSTHIHEHEISKEDRAHYSKRTIDFEYDYPFGRKELYGLAYRADFDLKNHMTKSGEDMSYTDPETGDKFVPHVIEPSFGLSRSVLITLLDNYREDGDRVYLKLPPRIAPYKAAVFPLLSNREELRKKARGLYTHLKSQFSVTWDDRGNIGKRYYSQDEIGTPYCITVDFETLEKDDVTIRFRDTAKQERMAVKDIDVFLKNNIA